ncbi:MAG: hypothetical protein ISN26_01075 [Betaproteobacteria bacterium AqS2]|uniref:Ubiquinone biosynthesis accessory factor UbiK n=1 Tax=Candidatus Amphirhobacter heronislandensis TaxID=1732024 RepID=A0A930UDQ0_9GAMM|nr:hypothetical protein [Betaproteobacteria bacterium AqS2]
MSKDKNSFEEWFATVFDRDRLAEMSGDMRRNTKAMFESLFHSVDMRKAIVTRDEFRAQQKMLADLAKKVERLEKALGGKKPAAKKRKPAKKKTAA